MSAPDAEKRRATIDVETSAVNALIHTVLRIGLIVSAALLVLGVLLWLARGGTLPLRVSGPVPALRELAALEPNGFFSLGLFALILTPFVRVAGSIVVFLRVRDARYALITAAVLAIMIASLLLGEG